MKLSETLKKHQLTSQSFKVFAADCNKKKYKSS